MSHELRTPLNSLLILSDQLSRNAEGHLTAKEVEFAKTIHTSGNDLLNLINDILDLSKIESGTVTVDLTEMPLAALRMYLDRTFKHVADSRGLEFELDFSEDLPSVMLTDVKRVQQILKNLLSNAFKFTERGVVRVTVSRAVPSEENTGSRASSVPRIVFAVTDTGIGIPPEKQQIIFSPSVASSRAFWVERFV
jgi:signal transduction histidine kinase